MNLSARIKSAKNKPNYVLNVNINIPIRPSNLQSYRPVSGQFTFSPNHHNKKLKLQIPSARTTNECESRKISYLGQTQNTISYRQNNRKKGARSAFPADQISQLLNATKKSKTQFRSQAVSPNGKRLVTKKSKILSSHQIAKSKQLVHDLITESQDNIMRYTNQSSELEGMNTNSNRRKAEPSQSEDKEKPNIKKLKLKSESPILEEEKVLIYGIRQFQKTAQFKKQHLNYEYLKSKLLILASVKKIQRAWRNYKTKKLIKSYSNNISLKFTGKMKNQLSSSQEAEEPKILTVRSCGYNSQASEFKRQGKKNLSLLYPREQQKIEEQFLNEDSKLNQTIILTSNKKEKQKIKNDKAGQKSVKSAIVKFQMEEIKKWEELIKNIKQGKKVEDVLEKSFRRKEELEKQLSNNLKEMISSKSSELSNKSKEGQKELKRSNQPQIEQNHNNDIVNSQVSVSSQNQTHEKLLQKQEHILRMEQKQRPFDTEKSSYDEDEEGATTQRRRQKLEYFENELRRIDNEYSQSNLSHSQYSESSALNTPEDVRIKNPFIKKDAQEEQNVKLKRKIEAINRVQMFHYQQDEVEANGERDNRNRNYLYTSLQQTQAPLRKEKAENTKKVTIKQIEETYEQRDGQFFPLTIDRNSLPSEREPIQYIEDDRLETFRNKNIIGSSRLIDVDMENLRLKQLKKKKLSEVERSGLVAKIEEEILFDLLLEFSEREGFIAKMEALYIKNNQKPPEVENQKPEGICTNLESIKDYLQNFVAFAFDQESILLVQGFNQPKGPTPQVFMKSLKNVAQKRKESYYNPVLSQMLFNQHWMYASEQIYFDAKYPTDPSKQQERVKYLKQITKMYFKAIFDCFNQCLEEFRVYGTESKPFPWQFNLRKKSIIMNLVDIKPLIRAGYRKLSQMAVVYCGLLFEDKKHSMSLKMIQQLQKQRLDTLVEMELEANEHSWESIRFEKAEVLFKIGDSIWQSLVKQACDELMHIK